MGGVFVAGRPVAAVRTGGRSDLQLLCQTIHQLLGTTAAPPCSHRGEKLRLPTVRQKVHPVQQPEQTFEKILFHHQVLKLYVHACLFLYSTCICLKNSQVSIFPGFCQPRLWLSECGRGEVRLPAMWQRVQGKVESQPTYASPYRREKLCVWLWQKVYTIRQSVQTY